VTRTPTPSETAPVRETAADALLRISARTDYAVRAAVRLAGSERLRLVKSEEIARQEGIPLRFLLNILSELRRGGIVQSHRGSDGGYRLVRDPSRITVADVITAVGEGCAGSEDGSSPPHGSHEFWGDARDTLGALLQDVTLADLAGRRTS
jgi:Rrf2 family protein